MRRCPVFLFLVAAALFAASARAQVRPYAGYIYPAGGQQGTKFQVKLGGQGLDDLEKMIVSGAGVTATVLDYQRPLNPQEMQLLNEQLRELRRPRQGAGKKSEPAMMMESAMMDSSAEAGRSDKTSSIPMVERLEKRIRETVNRPASAALAGIAHVEVTIARDAEPGRREVRLVTGRGVSNPLVFYVGQLPEHSRKAMITAPLQVLGKEEQALRKRPVEEVEETVKIPCTLNGQVASGENNRYRFGARQGQKLVINTRARELIPFIADAVPGWFQPVIKVYSPQGKEVAYQDDFRFCPDPSLVFEVPQDGDYVLEIHDAIYRGREDFVYRITLGEVPFVTSHFPLGAACGSAAKIQVKGPHLDRTELSFAETDVPGVHWLSASGAGLQSQAVPVAVDALPECMETEPNELRLRAQKVTLPIVVNGRMDKPGDADVYAFTGKAGQQIVAAVQARKLGSPLDSSLKLMTAQGHLVAFNDDAEDPGAGANTHHADSLLQATLPADGTYYVQLEDTARQAGEEYGYRLRLSEPCPDFELRVVPSSLAIRGRSSAAVSIHLNRKEGFTAPVKLALKDPPRGFSANAVTMSGTQTVARLTIRADLAETPEPVRLTFVGTARAGEQEMSRLATPAEDRMQAFLWRHLVPATDFQVLVYAPNYQARARRMAPTLPEPSTNQLAAAANGNGQKPRFTKQQVAGRLRQLKLLYEEDLLTDKFYLEKVAECEAVRLQ